MFIIDFFVMMFKWIVFSQRDFNYGRLISKDGRIILVKEIKDDKLTTKSRGIYKKSPNGFFTRGTRFIFFNIRYDYFYDGEIEQIHTAQNPHSLSSKDFATILESNVLETLNKLEKQSPFGFLKSEYIWYLVIAGVAYYAYTQGFFQ